MTKESDVTTEVIEFKPDEIPGIDPKDYLPIKLGAEHSKVTVEALKVAMETNMENMRIAKDTDNKLVMDKCQDLQFVLQDLMGIFIPYQIQLSLQAQFPEVRGILSQIKLPKHMSESGVALALNAAQVAIDGGMTVERLKALRSGRDEEGNVVLNEEKLAFYKGKKVLKNQQIKLDNALAALLMHGNREIALKETVDFFLINPDYAKGIVDLDIYEVRKEAKEKAKKSFMELKPGKRSWFAMQALDPKQAEEKGKAPEDYWDKLNEEDKKKVILDYLNTKVPVKDQLLAAFNQKTDNKKSEIAMELLDPIGFEKAEEIDPDYWKNLSLDDQEEVTRLYLEKHPQSVDNENFLLSIVDELPDDKGDITPVIIGKNRVDVITENIIRNHAHQYLEHVKKLKGVDELCPEKFNIEVQIAPMHEPGKTYTLILTVRPAKVLFENSSKEEEKLKAGYVQYDSRDTLEIGIASYTQTIVKEYMAIVKGINTFGELTREVGKNSVFADIRDRLRHLGVIVNEIRAESEA